MLSLELITYWNTDDFYFLFLCNFLFFFQWVHITFIMKKNHNDFLKKALFRPGNCWLMFGTMSSDWIYNNIWKIERPWNPSEKKILFQWRLSYDGIIAIKTIGNMKEVILGQDTPSFSFLEVCPRVRSKRWRFHNFVFPPLHSTSLFWAPAIFRHSTGHQGNTKENEV